MTLNKVLHQLLNTTQMEETESCVFGQNYETGSIQWFFTNFPSNSYHIRIVSKSCNIIRRDYIYLFLFFCYTHFHCTDVLAYNFQQCQTRKYKHSIHCDQKHQYTCYKYNTQKLMVFTLSILRHDDNSSCMCQVHHT